MKQGLLLGMALALALSLPAAAGTATDYPDSIIIDNVAVAPGQGQVLVPVYFVTFGDVAHYNLPLRIESSGDIHFQGFVINPSLEGWDDNWQGINDNRSEALNLGFADLGGDNNPYFNTSGNRVEAFKLVFSIDENPTTTMANIVLRSDSRTGDVMIGYSDGLTGVTPVVREGSITLQPTDVPSPVPLPSEVGLKQNYPNPFNPTTEIEFALPDARFTKLTVFNILGQTVRNLLSDKEEAGYHKIIWNGRDNAGSGVPSGTYFYKLEAGDFTQTMKMIMLK